MSALARRRNQDEGIFAIPGLGENNQRPPTGGSRSASVLGGSLISDSPSKSQSPSMRPNTAPVFSERRNFQRRTAHQGGATDSSQMSSLMWEPPSPEQEEVEEEPFVEVHKEGGELEATPFFASDNGTILIKGGQVVNADEMKVMDVLVVDGTISAVGEDLVIPEGATVIDATDKLVLPGGIDTNTHLFQGVDKLEMADDFESGTRAALAGGTTLVVDLVLPERGSSLLDAFTAWKENADSNSCCNFALSVAVPHVNEESKAEMAELSKNKGVNSFKMFMSFKDELMLNNGELIEVFQHVKDLGCIAKVHAENGDIIAENRKRLLAHGVTGPEGHPLAQPEEVEEEAVRRACTLAKQTNVPLFVCSPTSSGAADIIRQFKEKGLSVIGEPCSAAICLDGSQYFNKCWDYAASFVTSPPLRTDPDTKEKLLDGLTSGELDLVASNSCSYSRHTRAQGQKNFTQIPGGITGIEERMAVMYEKGVVNGKMELTRFVEVTSTTAAKLLNCYPRKGCIAEGSDADIVVWNPNNLRTISQTTQHQSVDFNIFEGMKVKGAPEFVLCSGKIVVAEYQINAIPGSGNYVEAQPFPPVYYDKIQDQDKQKQLQAVYRIDIPTDDVDGSSKQHDDMFGMTTPRGYSHGEVFNKKLGIYQRALSAHGVRNQQDSSFSLDGGYKQGEEPVREPVRGGSARQTTVRVNAPPGGDSGSFW